MAQTNFTPISLYYSTTAAAVPSAGNLVAGELAINTQDGKLFYKDAAGVVQTIASKAGALGDVVGPASATDNAVARFDATTGKLIQNSLVTVSDTGAISAPVDASISGLTVGKGAGAASTNTVVGANNAFATNSSGTGNSVFGNQAMTSNTSGANNNAFGLYALGGNTTGGANSAFGYTSMSANTTGSNNTAYGNSALQSNTTASNNTAVGYQAGYSNTTGSSNTAIGNASLFSNTVGINNTAIGTGAGQNATGNYNVFVGRLAGQSATSDQNTLLGNTAGYLITSGAKNTVLGNYTGNNGGLDIRTANNYIVLSDGDANIRLYTNPSGFTKITDGGGGGVLSPTGTFHEVVSTAEGSPGLIVVTTNGSYTDKCLQVDAQRNSTNGTFQAIGYYNRGANAWRMYVQDNGNLQNTNNSYGAISDIKLKENIVDATPKLDKLMQVKVRNYNLKADQTHKQIGVIAQELEDVFPSLIEEFVDKDGDGNDLGTKTKAVKYSVFVPMLIKAVQELNAKVEAQALEIATLKGQ